MRDEAVNLAEGRLTVFDVPWPGDLVLGNCLALLGAFPPISGFMSAVSVWGSGGFWSMPGEGVVGLASVSMSVEVGEGRFGIVWKVRVRSVEWRLCDAYDEV